MGIKLKIKSLMHLIKIIVLTELTGSVILTDEYNWSKKTVEFENIESEDKFFGFDKVSGLEYGIIVSSGVL